MMCIGAGLAFAMAVAATAAVPPPHIIFFMADDAGCKLVRALDGNTLKPQQRRVACMGQMLRHSLTRAPSSLLQTRRHCPHPPPFSRRQLRVQPRDASKAGPHAGDRRTRGRRDRAQADVRIHLLFSHPERFHLRSLADTREQPEHRSHQLEPAVGRGRRGGDKDDRRRRAPQGWRLQDPRHRKGVVGHSIRSLSWALIATHCQHSEHAWLV